MQSNDVLIINDLIQDLKQKLITNQLGYAYRILGEGQLHPKIKQAFRSLIDLIINKQLQLQNCALLNRFYRICINNLVNHEQINRQAFSTQFSCISGESKELMIEMEHLVTSISHKLKEKTQENMRLRQNEDNLYKIMDELTKNQHSQQEKAKIKPINNEIAQLLKQLDAKQGIITRLNEQLSRLNEKVLYYQRQIQSQISGQISADSDNDSRFIANQFSAILSFDQCSILQSLKNAHRLPPTLTSALQKYMQIEVQTVRRLYSFLQQERKNFHTSIDLKNNILLVCLTVNDDIIGAFTSASFTTSAKHKSCSDKAFLFGMSGEKISLNLLKNGERSIEYQPQFFTFGNDEICIQCGLSQLTSYLPSGRESQLRYSRLQTNDYLLDVVKSGKVLLKNYEIYQVQFKK